MRRGEKEREGERRGVKEREGERRREKGGGEEWRGRRVERERRGNEIYIYVQYSETLHIEI